MTFPPGDDDFRGEAFDRPCAAFPDIEDERRQFELSRIRAEIMDIARDVASLAKSPLRRFRRRCDAGA